MVLAACREILGGETWAKDDGHAGGVTHDDDLLWDVVAFLQKLPELTPEQYQATVKSAPKSHAEMMREMGMDHDGGNNHD